MKLITITTLILFSLQATAQNKPLSLTTSQLSVKQIDSLAASIDTTNGLRTAITDGYQTPKGKRKPKTSFSDTYYAKPATLQLCKVEHGESLLIEYFYFYNDSLVLVSTSTWTKDGQVVQSGRYYFSNGVLFSKKEEGSPLSKPEAFLQHAALYLKDVKTMFIN
ncbi:MULTISPECIES: hypothetical protein [Niastella]|uniref:Uncharacterized protein n=1 Tax=Niastella soli TaxID=2821487 RepID=A0ABS3YX14_9BACT|nr:hypothetical protein [Niastella soli]MBO9202433.1 hypothetical protein [Niastella soli]